MLDASEALERSPFLANLKRRGKLAPSRLSDLLRSATGPKPPSEPELGECCGSSCKPCVTELWKQELRCWNECHPDGPDEDGDDEESEGGAAKEPSKPVTDEEAAETRRRVDSPKVEIEIEIAIDHLSLGNVEKG